MPPQMMNAATGLEKAALLSEALKSAQQAGNRLQDVVEEILQPGTVIRARVEGPEGNVEVEGKVVLAVPSRLLVALELHPMSHYRASKVTVEVADITAIL